MLDQLKNPPAQYRLAPFWVWNAKPEVEEIGRQIREMHGKGIGGFFLGGLADASEKDLGEKLLGPSQHAHDLANRLGMHVYQAEDLPETAQAPSVLDTVTGRCAANSEGRVRVPVPVLAQDWGTSLEQLKQSVDRQACLGANFFCPREFHYSVFPLRTSHSPLNSSGCFSDSVSQFYQATYWHHYKHFADYAARLGYVLSQGHHRPQAAVVRPGAYSDPLDADSAAWLEAICEVLLSEHVCFDLIDEKTLCRTRCEDSCLALDHTRYEVVVIPPMTAISYGAACKLQALVEDYGKVIGMMPAPAEDSTGDQHAEVRQAFADVFAEATEFLLDLTRPGDLPAALTGALRNSIKPDISVRRGNEECADVWCIHRSIDGVDVFLLANRAAEPREARVSLRCDGAPYMLNLETGEVTALPNCTQQGNRTVLLHRFERYGSLAVAFSNDPAFAIGPPSIEEGQEIALADEWEFVPEALNCLTPPAWTFNTLIHNDRELYEYSTTFGAEEIPEQLLLSLEDQQGFGADAGRALFVNEQPVTGPESWLIDVGLKTLDISQHVHSGTNSIRMLVEREGWTGDPVESPARPRLMGRFSLDDSRTRLKPGRTLLRSGSWTEQGYPYYSGVATYRQSVYIPDFARGQRVILRANSPADMVEFAVNGAVAAIRPWAPFEVDITPLVKPGINLIELRITNSLANMLQSEARPSGLIGGATAFIA